MVTNDWWAVLIGVVFVAAMAYTDRRDEVSEGIPPLIGAAGVLALDAIGGFDLTVYTGVPIVLFLAAGAFRTWKERRSSAP